MMARAVWSAILLATTGCTTAVADDGPLPPPMGGESGCDAAAANGLVGQAATAELGAEALRLTGARAIRWIQPGQAVTMDYRADRLNIKLDAQNRVEGITCG